jgi:hypothetical protein
MSDEWEQPCVASSTISLNTPDGECPFACRTSYCAPLGNVRYLDIGYWPGRLGRGLQSDVVQVDPEPYFTQLVLMITTFPRRPNKAAPAL